MLEYQSVGGGFHLRRYHDQHCRQARRDRRHHPGPRRRRLRPLCHQCFQVPETKDGGAETIDVDVLVVGMGGSGIAAAVSAAEAQTEGGREVSVLAIDKAGRYGGTSAFCGEPLAVNAPKFKEEFNDGEDYMDGDAFTPPGKTTPKATPRWTSSRSSWITPATPSTGSTTTTASSSTSPSAASPKPTCSAASTSTSASSTSPKTAATAWRSTPARTPWPTKYFANIMEDYEELGGEYMLETEAVDLIYDEATHTVTGVKAVGHERHRLHPSNAKAVILAPGGFAGARRWKKSTSPRTPT